MAVVVGEAAVKLRPETATFASEAERDIDDKLPGVARKAAGFFAAAFAAVGVGAFLGNAISEAVDLGESMSKVDVVFGDAAGQIADFAATASTALGQSENQALAAAGTFGSLFVGMGIGQQQAADMSTSMVTLASDMASFGNATPEEALDALRAGLIGEAEPLRRFGVMLDAAKIEAEAMRLGLADANGEVSEAAKAQAVYSLALAQTSLQQGDFQRTSEGLANQQRIMKAQFTDLSTDVGGLFVPALADAAAGITGGLMPALLGATEGLPALGVRFADSITVARESLADLAGGFSEAFVDGAAGSALLGEASLQGIAVTLGHVASQARDSLAPAFLSIQEAVGPALAQVGDAFSGAFGGGGGGGGILGIVVSAIEVIGPIIADYIARWLPVIEAIIPIIADVFSALAPIIGDLFAQLGPVLAQLLPIISQVAGIMASTLLVVIQALAPVLPVLVQAIGQIAQALAGAFLAALTAIAPVLPQLVQAIASVATALAGALAGALAAIIPVLPPLIDALLQLVLAALMPLLPILPIIANLVGGLIGALAPLLPAIAEIVVMLINLALQALTPLLPILPMLAGLLVVIINAFAPLIPVFVQIIALIIQLAIQAIMPLLPVITMLAGMIASLIPVIMPLITMWINLVSTMLTFGANLLGGIIGFVGGIIGWIGDLIGWFIGLPGRILGAIAGFGSLLFNKGIELIQGLVDGIASAASFVGNIAKNVVNSIIGFINRNVIDGINDLLEFTVAGITINPPDIPRIPTLHSGGVFTTDDGSGEGLALLRNDELVATPEQRLVADNLLRSLLDGNLAAPTPAAAAAAAGGIEVINHITQQPGESAASLATRVTQGVVWNLNAGITRPVGAVAS